MPRSKAVIEPIATASARRTTFKKRKASLFKKAMELSTLCQVDVCAIVSEGHDDRNFDIWPPREDAIQILSRFSAISEADKSKKMVDRVGYLSQQVEKVQLQLRKVQSENCELETVILLQEVLAGQSSVADVTSFEQVANLASVVEMRLREVHRRMHDLASATVPSLSAIDMWAPSAVLSENQMSGVTSDLACWSTGLIEEGKDGSKCFLGPTNDVAPMVVGPHVEDEIDKFFDSYGCDDEIAALLS
jgi:SRF-type transcription factor (DNA-binding and dimerisation domain)